MRASDGAVRRFRDQHKICSMHTKPHSAIDTLQSPLKEERQQIILLRDCCPILHSPSAHTFSSECLNLSNKSTTINMIVNEMQAGGWHTVPPHSIPWLGLIEWNNYVFHMSQNHTRRHINVLVVGQKMHVSFFVWPFCQWWMTFSHVAVAVSVSNAKLRCNSVEATNHLANVSNRQTLDLFLGRARALSRYSQLSLSCATLKNILIFQNDILHNPLL